MGAGQAIARVWMVLRGGLMDHFLCHHDSKVRNVARLIGLLGLEKMNEAGNHYLIFESARNFDGNPDQSRGS